jgi:hypothetical protein
MSLLVWIDAPIPWLTYSIEDSPEEKREAFDHIIAYGGPLIQLLEWIDEAGMNNGEYPRQTGRDKCSNTDLPPLLALEPRVDDDNGGCES